MFKKMLASVGIGSAKVDTVLSNPNVQIGGPVTGTINVKGGNLEQKIDNIYLEVTTTYIDESDDEDSSDVTREAVVQKVTIPVNSVIAPGQTAQVPFQFVLAPQTPVTHGKTKVWIHTGLDIKKAIDPTDKDYLTVYPHPYMGVIFDALAAMGFQLKSAENEESKHGMGVPFIQEFEFKPGPAYASHLKELEVVFFVYPNEGVGLMMEVDRKAKGLKGMFRNMAGKGEANVNARFTHQELQQGVPFIGPRLQQIIESYMR